MTKRPPLPRRVALALMEHAASVLPPGRESWAKAMQHELPEIENDLKALGWASGCLIAGYLERSRAMLTRERMKIGLAAFFTVAAISAASWWAGQRPYVTAGNRQVFHEESNLAALAGFLVFIAAAFPGLAALLGLHDRKFHEAARAGRFCAVIMVPYLAALTIASLLTPGTVVTVGDSYCYDLWCLGVKKVNATPSGQDILYTAEVGIFVDSSHLHYLPAEPAKNFFYVVDDQGRRYHLLRDSSFVNADVTVHPGESLRSSFAFLAARNARKLYLMGNAGQVYLPWVYLYFGSDVSLFHRPALLRIL